jgi:hypothetical protein
MDELVRRFLKSNRDDRQVIPDAKALYYGVRVNDQSLTPGKYPRVGSTRFDEWLTSHPVAVAP